VGPRAVKYSISDSSTAEDMDLADVIETDYVDPDDSDFCRHQAV
jgi:hypothetical protein